MSYTGKKPIDVVDATTAQTLNVTDELTVDTNIKISGTAPFLRLTDTDTGADSEISASSGFGTLFIDADKNSDGSSPAIIMRSQGSEHMRVDSSGNVLVGLTSGLAKLHAKTSGSQFGMMAEHSNISYGSLTVAHTATSGTRYLCDFRVGGTGGGNQKGSITSTGTSVAYNTTSDHRLKENVETMTGAITRVKTLKPKRFNFIGDSNTIDGFLAHEAQTVVPEAVHGTHNEVDDDGNAVYQGIDQSKLVPLLVGALQEAIAKIETLETKVAALEAAE